MLNDGEILFHIWCQGDSSVGITGSDATVTMWVGTDLEYLNFVKKTLEQTFMMIWDDKSTVIMTDEEFAKYTKEDE